jgi:hypothetical protein
MLFGGLASPHAFFSGVINAPRVPRRLTNAPRVLRTLANARL